MFRPSPVHIVACVFSLWVQLATAAAPKSKPATEEEMRRTLEDTLVEKFEFRPADAGELLSRVSREAGRLDPSGRGVPIIMGKGSSTMRANTGDFSVEQVPLLRIIDYIVSCAELKYWIQPDGVHVVKRTDPEPMFTKEFRVPPAFVAHVQRSIEPGGKNAAARGGKDCRRALMGEGMLFPKGATATLNEDALRLTVRNTQSAVEHIGWLFEYPRRLPVPEPDKPKFSPSLPLREKMLRIVLPEVKLENAHLKDAIESLAKLSARHDEDRPGEIRGVEIILEETAPEGDAEAPANPEINYVAAKVSLFTAVDAVARLGHRHLVVEQYGIRVTAALPPNLYHREYLLPPGAYFALHDELKRYANQPDWLRTGGVTSGPRAAYLMHRGTLIVDDSEEWQQAILGKVEILWRDYYAAREAER